MILPATLGFVLVWVAILVLSQVTVGLAGLVALIVVGVALSGLLVVFAHRYERHLQTLAETDPLTGLTNHRGFHASLSSELSRARLDGTQLSIVSVDLDNFKAINDENGHPYGDEVLGRVGKQLRACMRGGDVAARVGGEEFALILPATGGDLAYEIAERARSAISAVHVRNARLSCSAGIAVYPVDAEDAASLSQLADGALYWAKRTGKRRTRRFDPEHVLLSESAHRAAEIKLMLSVPGMIQPAFQPVVALANGRVVGYEALARFPDSPGRAPGAWFAQARACGLGAELEAAAIAAALEPVGREPGVHLALNISPSSLTSDALAAVLPEDLSELVIELTEHEVFEWDDLLAETIGSLRDRGALIAIDDAGAGYAGLKQLMWVKPDVVKLDRELIRGIGADPARMALTEAFVRFAGRIGATVCAEGIESLSDVQSLANLDVPWGQGYALGRPEEPWSEVPAPAVATCRSALAQALRTSHPADASVISAGDRGLETLSARLAGTRTRADLYRVLGLIAAELNADKICLSRWHSGTGEVETLAESGQQPEHERFAIAEYPLSRKVLDDQEAVQVLIGDPSADPAEVELMLDLGFRSLLMTPVIHWGQSSGLVEAFSRLERPWTRTEINRARIISNQFASAIEALALAPEV